MLDGNLPFRFRTLVDDVYRRMISLRHGRVGYQHPLVMIEYDQDFEGIPWRRPGASVAAALPIFGTFSEYSSIIASHSADFTVAHMGVTVTCISSGYTWFGKAYDGNRMKKRDSVLFQQLHEALNPPYGSQSALCNSFLYVEKPELKIWRIPFPVGAPFRYREIEMLRTIAKRVSEDWQLIDADWRKKDDIGPSLDRLIARGFVKATSESYDRFHLTTEGMIALGGLGPK